MKFSKWMMIMMMGLVFGGCTEEDLAPIDEISTEGIYGDVTEKGEELLFMDLKVGDVIKFKISEMWQSSPTFKDITEERRTSDHNKNTRVYCNFTYRVRHGDNVSTNWHHGSLENTTLRLSDGVKHYSLSSSLEDGVNQKYVKTNGEFYVNFVIKKEHLENGTQLSLSSVKKMAKYPIGNTAAKPRGCFERLQRRFATDNRRREESYELKYHYYIEAKSLKTRSK